MCASSSTVQIDIGSWNGPIEQRKHAARGDMGNRPRPTSKRVMKMNDDTIYSELTSIFHEVFDDESLVLRPQMTAADVTGWDSFKQVEILIAVQERFGLKLRSREIDGLGCVGDLVEVIKRNQSA
jgi:acyl carrier protein